MSRKIDNLKKNVAKQREDLASLQAQRIEISNRLAQRQADKASADDIGAYAAINAEIRTLHDQLEFVDMQISKQQTQASRDEAIDAWNEYAADYNKNLAGKIKAIDKARKDLEAAYIAALELQNEALGLRMNVAELAGIKPNNMAGDPYADLPMNTLPSHGAFVPASLKESGPELSYFIATGIWDAGGAPYGSDAVNTVGSIVRLHIPVEKVIV